LKGDLLNRQAMMAIQGYVNQPLRGLLFLSALAAAWPLAPSARAQDLTEDRRVAVAERLSESTVQIEVGRTTGSGFVVGPERLVVTNAHVVHGFRRAQVVVEFKDRDRRRARVLAYDEAHDLAVLEAEGEVRARPLPLGDPDAVRVGQTVLAFGSPFGLSGTLTQGIVSARRDLPGSEVHGLIQTDAPINPGNSGGPLVNARGEVIGVNTAILSRSGGSQGIGFAVPSSYVSALLGEVQQALARRRATEPAEAERAVARGEAAPPEPDARGPRGDDELGPVWLGILGGDFEGEGGGVQVQQVVPGSPAAEAGLRGALDQAPSFVRRLRIPWTGHIIVAVDGRRVRGMQDLKRALLRHRPGERATVSVTVGPGAVTGETLVVLAPPPVDPTGALAPRRGR
jgi:putative serine protease PepD